MSWLARSIANTLKFDDIIDNKRPPNGDVSDPSEEDPTKKGSDSIKGAGQGSPSPPAASPRGVKDDLSEISKTLTRQFWGVASFLAPPPQSEPYKPLEDSDSGDPDLNRDSESESDPAGIMGIRNDFAEIGGKFRTGISMISNNIAVSEITKLASNFLQLASDNEEEEAQRDNSTMVAVGVTDEVVSFARDIAMHPETWLDFPLPENGDGDDFDMSDAQEEHALAVERVAPRLAALRMELCPGYMSEACFWKIYFVLLHPRLESKDAELLSTPQIVKARASLSHELKSRTKTKKLDGEGNADVKDISGVQNEELLSVLPSTNHDNVRATSVNESATSAAAAEYATERQPVRSIEIQTLDKPAIQDSYLDQTKDQKSLVGSSNVPIVKDEDDTDDWLKEESSEVAAGPHGATISVENEEDVSFSDLEEDDADVPSTFKKASYNSDKDTPDWVQL